MCNKIQPVNNEEEFVTCKNCKMTTLASVFQTLLVSQMMIKTDQNKVENFTCFNHEIQSFWSSSWCPVFSLGNDIQGPVSRKSRELFGPEKLVVKLQSARFEKLIFLHALNIRKIKRIAKFEGLELRRCEDIKGIVVPNIGPKSFGTFEKQAPGWRRVKPTANLLEGPLGVREGEMPELVISSFTSSLQKFLCRTGDWVPSLYGM